MSGTTFLHGPRPGTALTTDDGPRDAVKTSEIVAEFVANSQNLGHTDVLTTLRNYGQIDRDRQRQLVTGLGDDE